jgi:hypothetical protein
MAASGFALSRLIRLMGEPRAALLRRLALGFLIASPWDFTKLSSATPFIKLLQAAGVTPGRFLTILRCRKTRVLVRFGTNMVILNLTIQ